MAYRLLLPKFGMVMQRAKVIGWKKEVGDYIEKEEAVLTVENEKLTSDIISMESGVLLKKVASVGETYLVGDTLAWLGAEGEIIDEEVAVFSLREETSQSAVHTTQSPEGTGDEQLTIRVAASSADVGGEGRSGRVAASPLAKKLAAELGVDYTKIPGTGSGGRIDKEDVLKYAESMKQQAVSSESAAADEDYTVVTYTGMRKAIGDKMQGAWSAIPMVTHDVRADVGSLLEARRQLNAGVDDKERRFSVNDLLLKLVAAALVKFPVMNATFEDDSIRQYKHINLGIATALKNGLIVPVIHKAEEKSITDISREAKELTAAAKTGKLTFDNVSGGTFTISNLGSYGSVDFFSPILNPPQVAILGVGRIEDVAVPVDGMVGIRTMMGLSLTYDHRAIDGATAAEFMKELLALLDSPARTLFL